MNRSVGGYLDLGKTRAIEDHLFKTVSQTDICRLPQSRILKENRTHRISKRQNEIICREPSFVVISGVTVVLSVISFEVKRKNFLRDCLFIRYMIKDLKLYK